MNTLKNHKHELFEIIVHVIGIVLHFYLLALFTIALNHSIR